MYKAGWTEITNVDYSQPLIDQMAQRSKHCPLMTWECADIFNLLNHFPTKRFDVAIDKGTLDALLTIKHDPWNPPDTLVSQMQNYMHQVASVLVPGGIFIHITFAQPHFRKRFLERDDWKVEVHVLGGDSDAFEYFLYTCQKT